MTTETMTVHKALAELKILDNRIVGAISNGTYCIANKHSNTKIQGMSLEDFKKTMQGSFDKVSDLIKRRNAIKRAVVLSNASTKVTIGDGQYTVAEAIEMKNHGIELEELFHQELRKQYAKAKKEIDKNNGEGIEERAEQYVIGLYGSKEKTNTEDFKKAKQDFIESQSYDLIDPLNIYEKIEELEEKISAFKSEVDAALSVSNATTNIEISY